jgi:hypothetical protein
MKSHELAYLLLSVPDTQIATHSNNRTYSGDNMRVCLMVVFGGEKRIGIGDFTRREVNGTNDFVIEEIDGKDRLPDNW